MRRSPRALVVVVVLIVLVAVSALSAVTLDGTCGGAIPCACGDLLVASRTLMVPADPITTGCCTGLGLQTFAYGMNDPDIPPLILDLEAGARRDSARPATPRSPAAPGSRRTARR
jgi:hypothetical protein